MKFRGSAYAGILIFYAFLVIFLMFFGIVVFHTVITGELNTIKNDMYLINRNVLMALNREAMGEDKNSFYEKEVKKLVEEEIKRQWNIDVSCVTEKGFIYKVDIEKAKITTLDDKMYIESAFNVTLRPIIFGEVLKDKLTFKVNEKVRAEKMKGWSYE